MNVGICEDNRQDAELLIKLLRELEGVLSVDLYISAEQLLDAYSCGKRYDMIFMDIRLPGVNGFDAAKKIHADYYGERPLIVFLTITDKYVFDAYNVGWDYVCKPIDKERIQRLYARTMAELSHRKISLQTTEGLVYLETKDIYYIESYYGLVNIFTKQMKYQSRLTFEEIQELLHNRPFCKVHRSYIVNLRHVTRHTQTDVYIANGTKIPMSRNQRKPFIESLENFHRGNYYG